MVRGVARLGFLDFGQAAIAISWIALWFACWGVIRFTAAVFPESKAWRAGMLLAFFPASVFLLSGYAESLFVALSAWTLVCLAERRVWMAAGCCALATATRPEGVFLAMAVVVWAVLYGLQIERHREVRAPVRFITRIASLGLLSVSGFVAYTIFLWTRYHNPVQEVWAQSVWRRVETWPLHPLWWSINQVLRGEIRGPGSANATATYLFNDAVVVFAVIFLAALVGIAWRRRNLWWVVLPSLASFFLIVTNAPWGTLPEAEARGIMCIVPLYAVAARVRSEMGWTALLAGSAVVAAVFQGVFNTGGWLT
jgi:Gpi18-like mannosyltransferase